MAIILCDRCKHYVNSDFTEYVLDFFINKTVTLCKSCYDDAFHKMVRYPKIMKEIEKHKEAEELIVGK